MEAEDTTPTKLEGNLLLKQVNESALLAVLSSSDYLKRIGRQGPFTAGWFCQLKLLAGPRRVVGAPLSHLWTAEPPSPPCSRAGAAFAPLTRKVYETIAELMVLRNSVFKTKHRSLHSHQILLFESYSLSDNSKSPDSGNVDSLKQRRW